MKSFIYAFIFCFGVFSLNAHEHEHNSIHFDVFKKNYTFSTEFEIISKHDSHQNVVKSLFHVRTHYDFYDRHGQAEVQGICRFFSLGIIFTWAAEIDIYDNNGQPIGLIDGQVVTSEPAKFSLYDENGVKVGIAYSDQDFTGFTIYHPENNKFRLARLHRVYNEDTLDHWEVSIFEPDLIPEILIKVFAVFACDTQAKFKIDR